MDVGQCAVGQALRRGDQIERAFLGDELAAEQHAESVVGDAPSAPQGLPSRPQSFGLLREALIVDGIGRRVQPRRRNAVVLVQPPVGGADGEEPIDLAEQMPKQHALERRLPRRRREIIALRAHPQLRRRRLGFARRLPIGGHLPALDPQTLVVFWSVLFEKSRRSFAPTFRRAMVLRIFSPGTAKYLIPYMVNRIVPHPALALL